MITVNQPLSYGFIGAGNMSKAIIHGMLNSNQYNSKNIVASTASAESAKKVSHELNILCDNHNDNCLSADVIVLAVKPQLIEAVLSELPKNRIKDKLIISVIAGKSCQFFQSSIHSNIKIVRTMPNIPCAIGLGMTGMYAKNCTKAERLIADSMMKCTGKTLWVDAENKINAINAISGSGPAYIYLFIQELSKAGINLGLTEKESTTLALQTFLGTSKMADNSLSNVHNEQLLNLSELIAQITSKGGTTHQALNAFEEKSVSETIAYAVNQCYQRAKELGE